MTVERNLKASQNPPMVVPPVEEEEEKEREKEKMREIGERSVKIEEWGTKSYSKSKPTKICTAG
jgi:hypothetical protein